MATGRPWTDQDHDTLRRLHSEGRSLTSLAVEMERSKGSVSYAADRIGLSWDRTRTATASAAKAADNKARRVAIVERMYTRIEKLQDRLDATETSGFRTILKGSFGVEETKTLDFVPTADERNLADTLSRYVVSAAKLEAVDAGNSDTGKSVLSELMGGLRAMYHDGLNKPPTS